ncbi:MAG: hypothetical protein ACE5GN_06530 [Waddliaceae bacterium]
MNRFKKMIAVLTLAATLSTSAGILNADYCSDCNSGCGYDDCCRAPCISPTVALGTVAVVAAIAIIIHNKKNSHSHHAHS